MSEENFSTANIPESNSAVIEHRDHNDNPALNAHKEEAPEAQQEDAKPQTRMQAIEKAAADIDAKNAEKDKPKEDAESTEDGDKELKPKADKDDKAKAEQQPKADKAEVKDGLATDKQPKPSEGRRIIEAPDRFLPKAKEVWNNVPHPVREEFERVMKEKDAEVETYRESQAFREELRDYEAMAKQHNTSIKQQLDIYVDIDKKFMTAPSEGFKQILTNLKMDPSQAIGHILQAYNVSPEVLARHLSDSPQSYRVSAPQQQQQQPHISAMEQKIAALEQKITQQEQQVHMAPIVKSIEDFAEKHTDFWKYQSHIENALQSGIIDKFHGSGLSSHDKLEAAYRLVKSQLAPAQTTAQSYDDERTTEKPAVDLRGNPTKSIKGSPSAGLDAPTHKGAKLSRKDAIAAAMAELGVR